METMRTIMLTRTDEVQHPIAGTGRPDLGIPPRFETIRVARSQLWLNEGTADDYARAVEYMHASVDGWTCVHSVDVNDQDPFTTARMRAIRLDAEERADDANDALHARGERCNREKYCECQEASR